MTRLEIAAWFLTFPACGSVAKALDLATELMLAEAERDIDYRDMSSTRQALDARKILEREAEGEGKVPF